MHPRWKGGGTAAVPGPRLTGGGDRHEHAPRRVLPSCIPVLRSPCALLPLLPPADAPCSAAPAVGGGKRDGSSAGWAPVPADLERSAQLAQGYSTECGEEDGGVVEGRETLCKGHMRLLQFVEWQHAFVTNTPPPSPMPFSPCHGLTAPLAPCCSPATGRVLRHGPAMLAAALHDRQGAAAPSVTAPCGCIAAPLQPPPPPHVQLSPQRLAPPACRSEVPCIRALFNQHALTPFTSAPPPRGVQSAPMPVMAAVMAELPLQHSPVQPAATSRADALRCSLLAQGLLPSPMAPQPRSALGHAVSSKPAQVGGVSVCLLRHSQLFQGTDAFPPSLTCLQPGFGSILRGVARELQCAAAYVPQPLAGAVTSDPIGGSSSSSSSGSAAGRAPPFTQVTARPSQPPVAEHSEIRGARFTWVTSKPCFAGSSAWRKPCSL